MTPEPPYRASRPLAEIIPPDRRRLKIAALVVVSMLAGAALYELVGRVLEATRVASPVLEAPAVAAVTTNLAPVHLVGPDGPVTVPRAGSYAIVNVWLQGCQDCMPAFEAMRGVAQRGELGDGVEVVNVAYGEADPAWAARYGVRENLVFDADGKKIVKPLGIDTFTTLVVDPNGTIVLRDRPDRAGFVARVRAAVHRRVPAVFAAATAEASAHAEVAIAPQEPPQEGSAAPDPADVDRLHTVVENNESLLEKACWSKQAGHARRDAEVTLTLTVSPAGQVVHASSNGNDLAAAECVEQQAREWIFEPLHATTTVSTVYRFGVR